jgi:hypothetical protein
VKAISLLADPRFPASLGMSGSQRLLVDSCRQGHIMMFINAWELCS